MYALSTGDLKSNLIWGKRKSLSYVYVELTNRCNLGCEYCQVDVEKYLDMDSKTITDIIDQLSNLEVFELRLGGGEPLLYSQITEVVKYAKSKNMFVWLCTNGYYFNKTMASRLKSTGLTGIRISIDSTIPTVHDNVRRHEGAWVKCLDAIFNAKLFELEVVISMTIGSHNIDEYQQMCKFAQAHNCRMSSHFVMPKGKGIMFPKVDKVKSSTIIDNLTGEKHCVAATDTIYIDVEGNVSACSFLKPAVSIHDMPISEILKSEEMQKYTKPIGGDKCTKCVYGKIAFCPISNICRGGCWVKHEK